MHAPQATSKKLHPFSKTPASLHGVPAALFRVRLPCADSCDCGIRTGGTPSRLASPVLTPAVAATSANSFHDFVLAHAVGHRRARNRGSSWRTSRRPPV